MCKVSKVIVELNKERDEEKVADVIAMRNQRIEKQKNSLRQKI